jgi:hypothetical protein
MNTYNSSSFFKIIAVLLIAITLYGCGGGGAAPARKKMPEFNSLDGIEGGGFSSSNSQPQQGSFAFAPTNVDMVFEGSQRGFVSIPLPDAGTDSAAISLINTMKPFAMPMLAAWAQQQRNGVVIDLSRHNGVNTHRTDYVMQKGNDYSIPVVIIWDAASSYRVSLIKSMVDDVPYLKLNKTAGDDPIRFASGR